MRFFQMTKHPMLFQGTPWGASRIERVSKGRLDALAAVFRNRDRFAEQFDIQEFIDSDLRGRVCNLNVGNPDYIPFDILDHEEQYLTTDYEIIVIFSPYEGAVKERDNADYYARLKGRYGFKELDYRIYHPNAVTLYRVFESVKQINDVFKRPRLKRYM